MRQFPDFIIIGGMKCMTSTLHEQLARQPGVFMSTPKEPFYFSDDEVYAKGVDWYASLWENAKCGDLCGESSTHYTKLPTYPETVFRMHDACPNAKLLYVMRHPIDRLISQYVHEWTMGKISESIDEAIDLHPMLVDYSRYAYQIRPYLDAFGNEQILPIFCDRLRVSPQKELERICRFLGVEMRPIWDDSLGAQNRGSQRMRRSKLRDKVIYAPGISWIRQRLVPRVARDALKRMWQFRSKPTLLETRIAHLTELFDRDLSLLTDYLDLPEKLSCDNFNGTSDWELGPRIGSFGKRIRSTDQIEKK